MEADRTRDAKPIRLWPGVAIVIIVLLSRFVLPRLAPEMGAVGAMTGLASGLLIAVWWLFASRAPWAERLGGVALIAAGVAAVQPFLHRSMAEAGMGFLYFVYAVPAVCVAFVAWALLARGLRGAARYVSMVAAIVLASGVWLLVRTDGISGTSTDFHWRWSETAEERLLAVGEDLSPTRPADAVAVLDGTPAWPSFRGPGRDGVAASVRIATDWNANPPTELWRRAVGPGWSSFAVHGNVIYTQEQRGEEELVSAYDARSGDPVWHHADPVRFWEANAGAGPRGTPTLADGRVYAFGATGILNALDARDGSMLWSQDVAADTEKEVPTWGFSSSPLVTGDAVLVAASGRLVAYGRDTGDLRWLGPDGGTGYSSPQLATVGGAPQVLFVNGEGISGFDPTDGTALWTHSWDGYPIVQPASTTDGDLLLSVSQSSGTRRLGVTRQGTDWTLEERWTSRGLKPYFSDFVVHEGHAYGFDGPILAAIGLGDGERVWKGGRYGEGQMVLLPDQDLLLVISEKGELILVSATPDQHTELARHPAIEGKTWNHPVVVGDLLLVRNDREMVAFRLPSASG